MTKALPGLFLKLTSSSDKSPLYNLPPNIWQGINILAISEERNIKFSLYALMGLETLRGDDYVNCKQI